MLEKEIEKVVQLRDSQNKTFKEIGHILGFSEKTARRRYQASVLQAASVELVTGKLDEIVPQEDLKLPTITNRVSEDKGVITRFIPPVIIGDAFIIGDIHIPLHDPRLFNKMLAAAEVSGTKQCIVNGDFWHQEFASSFVPFQPEAALDVERFDGNVMMKTLLRIFDDVWLNCGNHDFRIVKKTGFKSSYEECMDWMFSGLTPIEKSRLIVTSLDYVYYYPTSQADAIRVCHPRNFSTVPLAVSRSLAVKYGMSVLTGHSHHLAMGVDQSGKYLIGDTGGFFDPNRTEYIQATNKGHQWVQGWWEFKDGVPTLKSPRFNNV